MEPGQDTVGVADTYMEEPNPRALSRRWRAIAATGLSVMVLGGLVAVRWPSPKPAVVGRHPGPAAASEPEPASVPPFDPEVLPTTSTTVERSHPEPSGKAGIETVTLKSTTTTTSVDLPLTTTTTAPPEDERVRIIDLPEGLGGYAITADPAANLWFSCRAGICRRTPHGALTTFALPEGNVALDIVAGRDGNVWFRVDGLWYENSVGRITPDGVLTKFRLPQPGLTFAPGGDGALWFTSAWSAQIERVDPETGEITSFAVSGPDDGRLHEVSDITPGIDGTLWFVDVSSDSLDNISLDGEITKYRIEATDRGGPHERKLVGLTMTAGGSLWFGLWSERSDDATLVGRRDPGGRVTLTELSGSRPFVNHFTPGPGGSVWFTINQNEPNLGIIAKDGTLIERTGPWTSWLTFDGQAVWFVGDGVLGRLPPGWARPATTSG